MNPLNKKWQIMEKAEEVIYNAIILDDESKQILKKKVPAEHENLYYHHITINHGKKEIPSNLGELVEFNVIGYAVDERGQAVVVDAESSNKVPHITLSCADDIAPYYSNELLLKGYEKITSFKLRGTVKSYTKNGWIP
jgi:transposase